MSTRKKKTLEPAEPPLDLLTTVGLAIANTRVDVFAAHAMAALIHEAGYWDAKPADIAKRAFQYARAMMRESEKL